MISKTKLLKNMARFREKLHAVMPDRVVPICACLDRNSVHCALIRDALLVFGTGDDCFRPRRCECGCHQTKS